jgi:hypothetical protein
MDTGQIGILMALAGIGLIVVGVSNHLRKREEKRIKEGNKRAWHNLK